MSFHRSRSHRCSSGRREPGLDCRGVAAVGVVCRRTSARPPAIHHEKREVSTMRPADRRPLGQCSTGRAAFPPGFWPSSRQDRCRRERARLDPRSCITRDRIQRDMDSRWPPRASKVTDLQRLARAAHASWTGVLRGGLRRERGAIPKSNSVSALLFVGRGLLPGRQG